MYSAKFMETISSTELFLVIREMIVPTTQRKASVPKKDKERPR